VVLYKKFFYIFLPFSSSNEDQFIGSILIMISYIWLVFIIMRYLQNLCDAHGTDDTKHKNRLRLTLHYETIGVMSYRLRNTIHR